MKTTLQDKAKAVGRGSGWRKIRTAHIKKHRHCEMCGRVNQLEVHHVFPWAEYEDLRYHPGNLMTLCRACHFRFGHFSHWKDYNPGVRQLVQRTDVASKVRKARKFDR